MKERRILDALGQVDEQYIVEAMPGKTLKTSRKWLLWCAVAACLVLICKTWWMEYSNKVLYFNLSDGILVTYMDDKSTKYRGAVFDTACLTALTEEQIFHERDTAIFYGEVMKIENIEIQEVDINGWVDYRAVVQIKVKENYRGACKEGDVVTLLLPCYVKSVNKATDDDLAIIDSLYDINSDYLDDIRPGTEGIFMPVQYTDDTLNIGHTELVLKNIAEYGIWDYRYVFLDNGDNISFDRDTFTSIQDANSMEEIEAYILKMLKE